MSVVEDLRGFERRVADRLRELEPLIAEYQELQRIAERLDIGRARATAAAPKRAPKPRKAKGGPRRTKPAALKRAAAKHKPGTAASTSTPTSSTTAVSDHAKPTGVTNGAKLGAPRRRDQLLALVSRKPGITVPEIAKQLDVDPTGLYRVVRQLEREHVIKKHGMELRRA